MTTPRRWACLLGMLSVASAATIFAIAPLRGSVLGGTKIIINGAGFTRGPMSGLTDTKVFVGAQVATCDAYLSTDSRLVCFTPPSVSGADEAQPISVSANSIDAYGVGGSQARCAAASCVFAYRADRTPSVAGIGGGGASGATLRLVGNAGVTDPDNVEVVQIGAGPGGVGSERMLCAVSPELQSTTDSRFLSVGDAPHLWNCSAGHSLAGYSNLSYVAFDGTEGWGAARFSRRATRVVPDGSSTTYHYVSSPFITSLNYNAAGVLGGNELVIKGSGFSTAAGDNAVTAAGVPCAVTYASRTELRCVPGPSGANGTQTRALAGAPVPGGRGLSRRVWLATSGVGWNGFANTKETFSELELQAPGGFAYRSRLDNYAQELRGFFVPPFTANFSFYLRSDDTAALYLSRNASTAPGAEQLVASLSGWCPDLLCYTSQLSRPFALQGGVPYAVRLTHTDGTKEDEVSFGVRLHTESNPLAINALKSPAQGAWASVPEGMTLRVATPQRRSSYTFNITGATAGQLQLTVGGQSVVATDFASIVDTSSARNLMRPVGDACGVPFTYVQAGFSRTVVRNVTTTLITLTFDFPLFNRIAWPTIGVRAISLVQLRSNVAVTVAVAQTSFATAPLEGYFRLRMAGVTASRVVSIPPIGVSGAAPSAALKAALLSLPGVADADVSDFTSIGGDNMQWRITLWPAVGGDLPALQLLTSDGLGYPTLLGPNATATVSVLLNASTDPFYWPAPMEWFRFPAPLPTVNVVTRGIMSACPILSYNESTGARVCTFAYDPALTPAVTGVSPSSVVVGSELVISGSGFLAPGPGETPWMLHTVKLNDSACNVTYADASQLRCSVQHAAAGTYGVTVIVGKGRGLARAAVAGLTVTYPALVSGVSARSGSFGGGQLITIDGTGFRADPGSNVVSLGSGRCDVTASSFSQLTCRAPAATGGATDVDVTVALTVNGVAAGDYTYAAARTARVTALSPAVLPASVSGTITLGLSGVPVGTPLSAGVEVSFGARDCVNAVLTIADDASRAGSVSCSLLRGVASAGGSPVVAPTVNVVGSGLALPAAGAALTLDTSYYVSSISPAVGSLQGGTEVTIRGAGLVGRTGAQEPAFVYSFPVTLDAFSIPCAVKSVAADGSSLTCTLRQLFSWERLPSSPSTPLNGTLVLRINNVTAPCPASACTFSVTSAATPAITSAVADTAAGTLTLSGSGLELFDAATADIDVGPFNCDRVVVGGGAVSCALPSGFAGTYNLTAYAGPTGFAAVAAGVRVTLPFVLDAPAVVPVGSYGGGAAVRLTGRGFGNSSSALSVNVTAVVNGTTVSAAAFVAGVAPSALDLIMPPFPMPSGAGSFTANVTVRVWAVNASGALSLLTPAAGLAFSVFTYASAATPVLASVRPITGYAGTVINITGSGFGAFSNATTVAIGGGACAVVAPRYNNTFIQCVLGAVPAGSHRVLVNVGGRGVARTTAAAITFTSPLEVSGVSAGAVTSYAGGRAVTLAGRGFAPSGLANTSTTVTLCGAPCAVTSASYSSLTCTTGSLLSPALIQRFSGVWTPSSLSSYATSLRGQTTNVAGAGDGDISSSFGSCWVQFDFGADARALVTGVTWYPRLRGPAPFAGAGALWRGSNEPNFVASTLLAQPTVTQEGWNSFPVLPGGADLSAAPTFRYLRWSSATTSDCTAQEVTFVGYVVAAFNNGTCPPVVTVTGASTPAFLTGRPAAASATNATLAVQYAVEGTPFIASVSPNNGTALGGDLVMLTGTGFGGAAPADVSVMLNSMPCAVQSVSDTAITCVTGRRTSVEARSVDVQLAPRGRAVYDATRTYFRYLDRWSALTTWRYNEPPLAGDMVVVPDGQAVLLDVSPPRLGFLLVQGELVFDRKDLNLEADTVFVHGGTLTIGTEAEPFTNTAAITIHGSRWTAKEVPEIGSKFFGTMSNYGDGMVSTGAKKMANAQTAGIDWATVYTKPFRKGVIDVHGIPRKRVWTKLGATTLAGSSSFCTAEETDFRPGEVVVLTSTSPNPYEAEEVTIGTALNATCYLTTAPFQYTHSARILAGADYQYGRDVDLRGEVGLLTRNIVIQGGGGQQQDDELFGVHLGAFHGGTLRLENAEVRKCGQAFQTGRYCSHFHMVGTDEVSYIRANSIHHSFQRAATVHASNNVRVQDNFAYRIHGHSIFMEDGVERANVIEGNLVAVTRASSAMLKSDHAPASFWAATPFNIWRHNVAAGSDSAGHWFELPGTPNGPSANPNTCPVNHQLLQFLNNTFHSSTFGLRIYPSWVPLNKQCGSTADAAPAFLYNSTAWAISDRGVFWKMTGSVHLHGWAFVDNPRYDVRIFKLSVPPAVANIPHVKDGLFICSAASAASCPAGKTAGIHLPKTEDFYADGAAFFNYGSTGSPLLTCNECDAADQTPVSGGYTYRTSRLSFWGSDRFVRFASPRREIVWDIDGTLTSRGPNSFAVPRFAFNDWPECVLGTVSHDGAHLCAGAEVRKVQLYSPTTRALDYLQLNVTSAVGVAAVPFRFASDWPGWSVPMVMRKGYALRWNAFAGDWGSMRMRFSERELTQPGSPEFVSLSLAGRTSLFSVRVLNAGAVRGARPSLGALNVTADAHGTFASLDATNKSWSFLMNSRFSDVWGSASADPFLLDATAVVCPSTGCDVAPPVQAASNYSLWSDPATWPAGRLPQDGDSIVIPANLSVLLDVPATPRLRTVTVHGALTFLDEGEGSNRSMTVENLVVFGSLTIGTRAAPYTGTASILFTGEYSGEPLRIDANLLPGNKVLVALGSVSMVAPPVNVSWTRLAVTAPAGGTTVALREPVDWQVGDTIVLGTTGYDASETETAVIASVGVDGATLELAAPLWFTHFGGPVVDTDATGRIELGGAVGRLTRTISLRGAMASDLDTYGFHMLVSTASVASVPGGAATTRNGRVDLRGVELAACGKLLTGQPCVQIQYGGFPLAPAVPATNPSNVLEQVSLDALYHGVQAVAAKNVNVTGSILRRGPPSLLEFDGNSGNAVIVGNLLLSAAQLVIPDTPLVWFRPQSAIYLASTPALLTRNYVVGAFDTAYTFQPDACGASPRIYDNEAVSARIGVFALSVPRATGNCVSVSSVRLWMMSHMALTTVDQLQNLVVSRAVIADSHVGISANFVRVDQSGLSYTRIENSVILGTTAASGSNCTRNTACRAVSGADLEGNTCGSVYGTAYRRVGIASSLYTNAAKTCGVNGVLRPCRVSQTAERPCAMPYEKRFGTQGAVSATQTYVTNVTFVGFLGTECDGKLSKAIAANPSAVEHFPPMTLSGIRWIDTPAAGKLDLSWRGSVFAGGAGSRAQTLALLQDVDGSTTGVRGASIISATGALANPDCTTALEIPGFVCPATLRGGFISSMDPDAGSRSLGTLQLTRIANPADNSTWRTVGIAPALGESCSHRSGVGYYPVVLQPGLESRLFFPGLEPGYLRLHFVSPNATEGAVLRIYLQRRFTWKIFVGGREVAPAPVTGPAGVPPRVTDPAGTYVLDTNQHALWVVVRGGLATYDLIRQAAVQVSMAVSVTVESFFADDFIANLARLLGIPTTRIKVVDVQPAGGRRLLRGPLAPEADNQLVGYWRSSESSEQRRLQADLGALRVDVQVIDTSPMTLLLNPDDAASVAAAREQYARMSDVSAAVFNLTARLSLAVGNVTVEALQVETPPPPPELAAARSYVVTGGFGNYTVVNGTISGIVLEPSVTPASTPTGTPSPSGSNSGTSSASPSNSATPSKTPSATVTATEGYYVRGTGNAPPLLDMLLWVRPNQFADGVGTPVTEWRNALDLPTGVGAAVRVPGLAAPTLARDTESGFLVPAFSGASALAVATDLSLYPQWAMVVVARPRGFASSGRFLSSAVPPASASAWTLGVTDDHSELQVSGGASLGGAHAPAQPSYQLTDAWTIAAVTCDADGTGALFRNGLLLGTAAGMTSPTALMLAAGGSAVDVAEVLLYRTSMGPGSVYSNATRADIEGYLARKYGLRDRLPSAHPFYVAPSTASTTHTPTGSLSSTRTPTQTGSATLTPTGTASPTGSLSSTGTPTATASKTGTASQTGSSSSSATATISPTGTPSLSVSSTGTATPSSSVSGTGTATKTAQPSRTGSRTAYPSRTRTASRTAVIVLRTGTATRSKSRSKAATRSRTGKRKGGRV